MSLSDHPPTPFVLDGDGSKQCRGATVVQIFWSAYLSKVHADLPMDGKSVWLVCHVCLACAQTCLERTRVWPARCLRPDVSSSQTAVSGRLAHANGVRYPKAGTPLDPTQRRCNTLSTWYCLRSTRPRLGFPSGGNTSDRRRRHPASDTQTCRLQKPEGSVRDRPVHRFEYMLAQLTLRRFRLIARRNIVRAAITKRSSFLWPTNR